MITRLNLGCGTDIRTGYVNVDAIPLKGVDIVHDLDCFPYPFADDTFEEIVMINVLEHLSNTVKVMEELWRISKDGAKVIIRVPYWNSMDFVTDPTHKTAFNEYTFGFFDPTARLCQKRPYYSKARFQIQQEYFYVRLPGPRYIKTQKKIIKGLLAMLAHLLCNIIHVLEYELTSLK